MSKRIITSEKDWNEYLRFTIEKALCHAPNVVEVVPKIIATLIAVNAYDRRVFERNGDTKRWMWFMSSRNKQYALVYDYAQEKVNLRRGRTIIEQFDNTWDFQSVLHAFQKL